MTLGELVGVLITIVCGCTLGFVVASFYNYLQENHSPIFDNGTQEFVLDIVLIAIVSFTIIGFIFS